MSTIAEEIQRLKQAKSSIKTSIENKGVTVSDTATLDNYAALIDSIEQTGGGTVEATLQEKTVSITANTTTEIAPDDGYDGMTKVTVTTTVKPKLYNGTKLGGSTFTWYEKYDLSDIKDFSYFFKGSSLKNVTSEIDLSNATNVVGMFAECPLLGYDNSVFDDDCFKLAGTEKIKSFAYFFDRCTNLQKFYATIDCTGATNLECMFYGCSDLRWLNGIKNTQNVTSMHCMFYSCNNFDEFVCDETFVTDSVTDINQMFTYSTVISLPRWNFSNVTDTTDAFKKCTSLTTLAGFIGLKASISFSDCPLTVDSMVNVFNEMYDFAGNGVTPSSGQGTLTLGATNLAKLSDEEKAVATNKGWTLA